LQTGWVGRRPGNQQIPSLGQRPGVYGQGGSALAEPHRVRTLYIEPDSPWENGYLESFNGKLRQEKLNGEIFYTLREAQVLIEQWRLEYNTLRPHSSLNYPPRHQKPGCTEGTSSGGTLTLGAGQRLRTILIRIAQILSLTFVFLINAHLQDFS
jgi:transposase InsO family protein